MFITGRGVFFFPRRDGVAFFFFRRYGTGRCFFCFQGPGRDGCFWRWQFFWRDGAKSLHRPAKGGLNRPASRPCKALDNLSSLVISTKSIYNHTSRPRASAIATSHQYPPNIINSDILYYLYVCPYRNRLGARHDTTRDVRVCSIDPCVRGTERSKGMY